MKGDQRYYCYSETRLNCSSKQSHLACASKASKGLTEYFYSYDDSTNVCEIGDADLAQMGTGELEVMMKGKEFERKQGFTTTFLSFLLQ